MSKLERISIVACFALLMAAGSMKMMQIPFWEWALGAALACAIVHTLAGAD